jgi:hypothetical protein
MDRRTFLQLSAMGLMAPSMMAKSVGPTKFSLKKNLVLVTLDLGLFEKNFREGGVNSKYMNDYFYDFKGDRTYFDGIYQSGMGGGHTCEEATFTCFKYEDRHAHPELPFISLDQHIAANATQETRHKLIYHRVSGGRHVSWNRFAQPMPAISGASALHNKLFEKNDESKERALIRRERNVLLALHKNIKRRWKGTPEELDLRNSIEYQLEELEEKEKWLGDKKPYVKKTFDNDLSKAPLINCHHNFQLIYDALEKKQTKIATVQFGGGLTRGLPGITHGYHTLSHHSYYPERTREFSLIDAQVLGGLKVFLEKLQAGGLLDETIVLFTCGMGDSNRHSNRNAPAFLFGGGFNHQESIACQKDGKLVVNTADLYTSILKQVGIKNPSFFNSKTPIKELF